MGKKRLFQLLKNMNDDTPIKHWGTEIMKLFQDWKGDMIQKDDITMLGIKP